MKRARDEVDGPFSIMQAYMDPPLSNEELLKPTHNVTYVALNDLSKISWSEAPASGMASRNIIWRTHT